MDNLAIIVVGGVACVAAILIVNDIYQKRLEKKSQKLIEDFIVLISTYFSEIEYFTDDPKLNERIAAEVRKQLYDKTFEHFKNLMLNVSALPQLEFKYVGIDPSKPESVIIQTKRFTTMIFPAVKELVALILKHGKKNKPEEMKVFVKIYADRLYHGIEMFVITELRIAQSKLKNPN